MRPGADGGAHGELVLALVQLREHQAADVHAAQKQHDARRGPASGRAAPNTRRRRTSAIPVRAGFDAQPQAARELRRRVGLRTPSISRLLVDRQVGARVSHREHPASGGRCRWPQRRHRRTFEHVAPDQHVHVLQRQIELGLEAGPHAVKRGGRDADDGHDAARAIRSGVRCPRGRRRTAHASSRR